jgi:chemotaxis signal transduction protein
MTDELSKASHALELAAAPDRRSHVDVLPIAVASIWLGLEARVAIEIVGETSWVRVPTASDLVPGVVAFRGRAVALVDLGAALPDVPRLDPKAIRARTILAETPHGTVALAVDRVREVISVRTDEIRDARLTRGAAREITAGEICMPLIDLGELLGDLALARREAG